MGFNKQFTGTLLAPVGRTKSIAIRDQAYQGRLQKIENPPCTLLVNAYSGQLVAVELTGNKSKLPPNGYEPINEIKFFGFPSPLEIQINGDISRVNPLPFAVLICVMSRFRVFGSRGWPKGRAFAERCSIFRKRIDLTYRHSTRDLENIWASWLNQARKEVSHLFPRISVYDLLPDGKTSKREGLHPRLTKGCTIEGVDETIWPSGV